MQGDLASGLRSVSNPVLKGDPIVGALSRNSSSGTAIATVDLCGGSLPCLDAGLPLP